MAKDPLQVYMDRMGKYKLLTAEEELKLTTLFYETKDKEACKKLILSNLKIVIKIATNYCRVWENILDLIQEGNMGLMVGIQKFDPTKGYKLSTYTSYWIKAYILKYIMHNWGLIKVGNRKEERILFYQMEAQKNKLIAQGFNPTVAKLANHFKIDEYTITFMNAHLSSGELSLELPYSNKERDSATNSASFQPLKDVLVSPSMEDQLEKRDFDQKVRKALTEMNSRLTDREIFIIEKRFLLPKPWTLDQLGDHFSLTKERIRQIEYGLKSKIKKHIRKHDGLLWYIRNNK